MGSGKIDPRSRLQPLETRAYLPMLRLGFLASNNGTAMRAVTTAIGHGELRARPCLIISNRKDSAALEFAAEHSIPAACIPTKGVEEAADQALLRALTDRRVDLVILSGYLRKLGPHTLSTFDGRILNMHPALLPKFGGKGMYGRRVHEAVLQAREEVTGATIHVVDTEYDHGRVIAARSVPVDTADDVISLERKVMQLECLLLVETLRRIAEGRLTLPL